MVLSLLNVPKDYIPINSPKYYQTEDLRLKVVLPKVIWYTENYRIITNLEKQCYENRKKRIPVKFIEEYLNEEALAWWYQDDRH